MRNRPTAGGMGQRVQRSDGPRRWARRSPGATPAAPRGVRRAPIGPGGDRPIAPGTVGPPSGWATRCRLVKPGSSPSPGVSPRLAPRPELPHRLGPRRKPWSGLGWKRPARTQGFRGRLPVRAGADGLAERPPRKPSPGGPGLGGRSGWERSGGAIGAVAIMTP
jgi:hypothetical protein